MKITVNRPPLAHDLLVEPLVYEHADPYVEGGVLMVGSDGTGILAIFAPGQWTTVETAPDDELPRQEVIQGDYDAETGTVAYTLIIHIDESRAPNDDEVPADG